MIVQWPGHTVPGTVRRELVSSLDLVPTLLEAADVRAQSDLPGRSLVPLLRPSDTAPASWRTYIQGITTGYQGEGMKTVIPSLASAKLDFRLLPHQDPDDIEQKLRAHLIEQGFEDVQVTRLGVMWPVRLPSDAPLVQLSAQTGEEVYLSKVIMWPMVGGSSPVYAFAKPLGDIPVIRPGLGYWNNLTHSPDEHIRIEDFHNAARIADGFADI